MSRTAATSQHSLPDGAGASVDVGLGHLIVDGTTLKISASGPADAAFVADGSVLKINESVTEGDAHLLRFGGSYRVRDNP